MLVTKPQNNSGIVLLCIGVFFLLPDLHIFEDIQMRTWWPIALIGVGVLLIVSHQEYVKKKNHSARENETRNISQEKKELK